MSPHDELADWFSRLEAGEKGALDRVIPLLYDDLRRIASRHLRSERYRHTMGTTALVNEAYLRLAKHDRIRAESRNHFFAIAGRTMRRVLVDYARTRTRKKRGGGAEAVPLDEVESLLTVTEAEEILALDEALGRLGEANERAATVVQYRFFAGLTLQETADVLDVSVKTVQREWIVARAWLLKEVKQSLDLDGPSTNSLA